MNEDMFLKMQEIRCGGSCADNCDVIERLECERDKLERENDELRAEIVRLTFN